VSLQKFTNKIYKKQATALVQALLALRAWLHSGVHAPHFALGKSAC
jgi:hypothetical protein